MNLSSRFGKDKKYKYPYKDYCLAERTDDFSYPDTEIQAGAFSVDGLNGDEIPSDRRVSITNDKGLAFEGWVMDDAHASCPSAVYVELDGNYYRLVPFDRPDVAEAFNNEAYLSSGVKGYVSTEELAPGTYPMELIVISADEGSYYTAPLLTVEITA